MEEIYQFFQRIRRVLRLFLYNYRLLSYNNQGIERGELSAEN
jgi:hypothetical protein